MQRKFILFALCLSVVTACGPMVRTARQQLVAGSVPATETATETTRVPAAVSATTATFSGEPSPEVRVAKNAIHEAFRNIPHLPRRGMLHISMYNAVFATPTSGMTRNRPPLHKNPTF